MHISDWSSDVCSSDLHSLNLRRLERRFRTMTAAAARMDRWCEFRPLAQFSKRQRSVMGIVIFPHGDDFFALEPQQPAILLIVEFAVGAIDLGIPFLEDDIPIRQHRAISEVSGPTRLRDRKTPRLNTSN